MSLDDQMRDIQTRQQLITHLQNLQDPCDIVIISLEKDPQNTDLGRPYVVRCVTGGIPGAMYLCTVASTMMLRESGL
jgi:hypothetical protein